MKLKTFKLLAGLAIAIACCSADVRQAAAVDGSEISGSVGSWAPFLPTYEVGAASDDQDDYGFLARLRGHHRFDGYRTSIEGSIFYGDAGDTSLFGYEGLLRDTWEFSFADLSAGGGFSQMTFDQDFAGTNLENDYTGGKVVAGFESMFGHRPFWIDFGLGLYDLNGTFTPAAGPVETIDEFTTTYSVALRTEACFFGVAARPMMKFEFLSDMASYQNGQLGTDDGFILSSAIEFRLVGR
ncbi:MULTISPECIES: hypothetical protein [Crateriforma]|uniref:Outer membrane protein beta-barrel domain-containing protein n=1 Tax=Crateriforma conspicua TaxID=2527996 RepID=A0A5C5Y3Y2_9PLAN|nr:MULTISPECIES: hypothetical protein [Crateriforma]QDV64959.1 hypothetical protein Mal65_41270 [Crateriforma conspicua]TWT70357.1 hypothetical protein Pan14r_26620 [Crateriforma conspicua]TWU65667.1 hypothetical protein V7x_12160 [Crateriforma conspicua]